MEQWQRDAFLALERAGYLPQLREMAMRLCAPFWWSTGQQGNARILHNGTICFVDTGQRYIGVTADHVYRQYLDDLAANSDLECQFGGSTVRPETRLIDRDGILDLATFDVPEVLVNASGNNSVHHPSQWPPPRVQDRQSVLYGGFPGVLRDVRGGRVDTPFQTFIWAPNEITTSNIVLYPDFKNLYWPGHEGETINRNPGGISGGPVFRVLEQPVDHIEIAGFIYEYLEPYERVLARHADSVLADGTLRR